MSVRHSLLALLERGPRYGYQLRSEFEAATGATWPLNVGQVYTTLARLERDGLVVPDGEPDVEGRATYRLTEAGRAELADWFASPVTREGRPRDELAVKLALAITTPGIDVAAVLQVQRRATVTALQELTRLKTRCDPTTDLAWSLVLDALLFQAEAEVRWLDHCEGRVVAAARRAPRRAPTAAARAATPETTRTTKEGRR